VRRSTIPLIAIAAGALSVASDGALADYRRLPSGIDNPMPRYYDYRSPRAFYADEAPVAYRLYGSPHQPYVANQRPAYPPAAVIYVPPAQYLPPAQIPLVYAPAGAPGPAMYLPPANVYAPPVQGYRAAPVVPNVVVAPQPLCGVYRFWRGDRCVDARGD
jgi:hypothetical protein